MHDLACSVRPVPNGALTPSVGIGPARSDRHDPFPGFVADWQDVIAFDLTVNATSEEGVATREIYGPFILEEISFRSGSAGGSSQQLRVAIGNDFPAPQAVVGSGAGTPQPMTTDSARTVGTFFATTVFERHQVRVLSRTDLTRIAFILNNTTGGAVTIVGHVAITHLRELSVAELRQRL